VRRTADASHAEGLAGLALRLLAGAVTAFALERLLPALAQPALRATLVFAPIPVALFAHLARGAGCAASRVERLAAAGWAVAAVRHDALGIPFSAEVVGALFFLLIGWRAAKLALALRRRLAARRLPRDLVPFTLLPAAVYLAILPWAGVTRPPDGDEPYYLLLAHSLAEDFDVDLADEYRDEVWRRFGERPIAPQPGDPVGPGGEVFSRHEPLLPLLLAPAYAAGGVFGARSLLLALAALAAGRLLAAARAQPGVTARGAFRAWALFALAPPLLLYSHQIWVEVPAALAVILVVEARARLRARRDAGAPPEVGAAADWLRFALPLVALPLLKLRLLLVAAPLALLVVAGLRRSRRLQLALAGGFLAAVALLLVVNQLAYGNPLKMHSVEELSPASIPLERFLRGGVGLLFDVAFGLAAAAPLWLLAVPALAVAVARLHPLCLEIAAFAPYLAAVASRREWYGGWSPPFRYGVVALPVAALAIALLASRRPPAAARVLGATLAAATLPLAVATLVIPGWSYNLADGGSHWLDAIAGRFPGDLLRLFPSAVRPRAATWLVPLAATLLALAVFRIRTRRPRHAVAAGVAMLFAGWALLLVAAHRLPTRVVELEDPWVTKSQGLVFPQPWVVDRTRHRGGWVLVEGSSATAPVVRGGARAALAIDWTYIRNDATPLALEVAVGERTVARLPVASPGVWRRQQLPAVEWPAGAALRLTAAAPAGAPPVNGLVVDRVEIAWLSE
jgi:hypothetical protein